MSATVRNHARSLLAAGAAPASNEDEVYLFNEEDGDLMKQLWTTTGPGTQTCIASGVKTGSPALDLTVGKEHFVFFIDESSTLSCTRYNAGEEEWEQYPLGHIQGISAHSQSKLSGCPTTDGAIVFFQTPSNQIQAIVNKGGSWCKSESIAVDASPGTPHCAYIYTGGSEPKLQLSYVDGENRIHLQSKKSGSDSWEDQVVEYAKFENPITHLNVQPTEDGKFQMMVLSDSKLVWFGKTGVRSEMGTVVNNEFIPLKAAESTIKILNFHIAGHNHGNIMSGGIFRF